MPRKLSFDYVHLRYEPVQRRVLRQIERLGITPEDPQHYTTTYGSSLLETEQLLAQIRELGINEDLVRHFFSFFLTIEMTMRIFSSLLRIASLILNQYRPLLTR